MALAKTMVYVPRVCCGTPAVLSSATFGCDGAASLTVEVTPTSFVFVVETSISVCLLAVTGVTAGIVGREGTVASCSANSCSQTEAACCVPCPSTCEMGVAHKK